MTDRPGAEEAVQRSRIVWLTAVLAAVGIYLLLRLAGWQLVPHAEYVDRSAAASNWPDRVQAVRGAVLDATDNYLVTTDYACSVYIIPPFLDRGDRRATIAQVASALRRPEESVSQLASLPPLDRRRIIAAGVPISVCGQLEPLVDLGVELQRGYQRVYPDDAFAAHVLGFVDLDGNGQYGVEGFYDATLRGVDGEWRGVRDPFGRPMMAAIGGSRPAVRGADLALTIDRNIQYEAERILSEGALTYKASAGNIIVLDPRTGAVLAMANYPSFYPLEYWYIDSVDELRNNCIGAVYEPGSVLKPLTLAAALEAKVIRATDSYNDEGSIVVGEQEVRNWDGKAHGRTTMTELLAYSRNVGAAYVASLLGPTRFYEMFRRFGFAEHTLVDLMAEERGIMRVPGDPYWSLLDLGRNAFGQGMSVTPLQVAAAYGALANNGLLMRPYMVAEVRSGAVVTATRPMPARQVVSPEVSAEVTWLMAEAVALGMKPAMVPGYRTAGKSGTAGVPDRAGYNNEDVVASFVGYGPLPDPRFVVLVKFDKPREGRWGVEVAAPEFRRMFEYLMDYAGIRPVS